MKDPTYGSAAPLRLVSDVTIHPKASPSGPSPPGGEPPRVVAGPARLAQYIHSDRDTPMKGIAVVRIVTRTDFAARTEEAGHFARLLAKFAFAAQSTNWPEIVEAYPVVLRERQNLEATLREPVEISRIVIVNA
jgi:hypothetical protein